MTAPEAALVLAKAVDGTPWAFYASRPPTSFRARLHADLAEQCVRLGAGPAQTLGSYSPWSAIDLGGFVAPFRAVLTP